MEDTFRDSEGINNLDSLITPRKSRLESRFFFLPENNSLNVYLTKDFDLILEGLMMHIARDPQTQKTSLII